MSSCEENLNDWQKLLVEKNYLQGVFLKQNSTQTLLACVSNNFGFKRRMKIRQYWSFRSESLHFTKSALLFPIPYKVSFLAS